MLLSHLFEFKNKGLMSRVATLMTKAGLEFVDNGIRAQVWKNRTGEIVKVFEYDPCYVQFISVVKANQENPHFPKIRKLATFKRSDLAGAYMIKMEPLTPVTWGDWAANIGFHCYMLIEHRLFNIDTNMGEIPQPVMLALKGNPLNDSMALANARKMAAEWEKENPQFVKAINKSIFSRKRNCKLDMHLGNFMKRGDIWVITDPYLEHQ